MSHSYERIRRLKRPMRMSKLHQFYDLYDQNDWNIAIYSFSLWMAFIYYLHRQWVEREQKNPDWVCSVAILRLVFCAFFVHMCARVCFYFLCFFFSHLANQRDVWACFFSLSFLLTLRFCSHSPSVIWLNEFTEQSNIRLNRFSFFSIYSLFFFLFSLAFLSW